LLPGRLPRQRATCRRRLAVDDAQQGAHGAVGIAPVDPTWVTIRRVSIELLARQDDAIPDGVVFIPFALVEAAANLLTNPALDPFGRVQVLRRAGGAGRGGEGTAE
jgi:hypothetical protein